MESGLADVDCRTAKSIIAAEPGYHVSSDSNAHAHAQSFLKRLPSSTNDMLCSVR
ncbi:hypothetical protein CBOM_07044 [Ceraceosorus bombacis]|uniref:Uncharacterized protein n=1 Tax=Ceraceosorus bombacis TaxID=401625 RepID=A0A0P1BL52_9BASI|nr:hypothetical protein CBOM_07044 [Ceraceosorus bombacis]